MSLKNKCPKNNHNQFYSKSEKNNTKCYYNNYYSLFNYKYDI